MEKANKELADIMAKAKEAADAEDAAAAAKQEGADEAAAEDEGAEESDSTAGAPLRSSMQHDAHAVEVSSAMGCTCFW